MRVVIIGGGTAGTEVAMRLRQKNKDIEIIILEKGEHDQYSPCSLPYYISGEIKKKNVFLLEKNDYSYNKIKLLTSSFVERVDQKEKKVFYTQKRENKELSYDFLVLAYGKKPFLPKVIEKSKADCYFLKTIQDATKIIKETEKGKRAIIVGSGYIGVELSWALRRRGLEVVLLEEKESILPKSLDKDMSLKVLVEVNQAGIKFLEGQKIEKIENNKLFLANAVIDYDYLFVSCGLSEEKKSPFRLSLDFDGGIILDSSGRTSDKNIFACGDIASANSYYDNSRVFNGLATTAVRQAQVVCDNILGLKTKNQKTLSSSVSSFGKLAFGSLGLNESECRERKINFVSARYHGSTKSEHFPGENSIYVKLVADYNEKILGCQLVGFSDVSGYLNVASLAIKEQITLSKLINTDTCYNPSITPIFNPLLVAAELCLKKIKHLQNK